MKKLILLRHAKSSWDDPLLDDHDRALNARGRAAAPVIARWLAHQQHMPDMVLASSSRRTLETVERMREVSPTLPQPVVEPLLYHAAPMDMRNRLAQLPETVQTVMLVGHQPGLGELTRLLADGREDHRCRRAYAHFPTAAAAVLELADGPWAKLDYDNARFVDFAKPRELMEA